MTISNLGLGDLDWATTVTTGESNIIGDWIIFNNWGCNGSPGSAGVTFFPDFTFTTSQSSGGTWSVTGNSFQMTFVPGGKQYIGT